MSQLATLPKDELFDELERLHQDFYYSFYYSIPGTCSTQFDVYKRTVPKVETRTYKIK